LAEATLRLPAGVLSPLQVRSELERALTSLFNLYGESAYFDVTVTANAILETSQDPPDYSVWYGQDFYTDERADAFLSDVVVVRDFGDISEIQTDYSLDDFQVLWDRIFNDTATYVRELVNIVYVFRMYLDDFARDRVDPGPRRGRVQQITRIY
jgi:hypothetical protein